MEASSDDSTAVKSVRIARNFEDISGWNPAYDRFLDELGDYGLFYRLGWLRAMWPAYSQKPCELFFISVWQGQEMLALAPFQILKKGPLQGWRRLLCFMGTHQLYLANPWPEILVRSDALRQACIHEITTALAGSDEWDQIDLNHWQDDSPNRRFLEMEWPRASFLPYNNRSAQINLDRGIDDYLASLSNKLRKQLRHDRRRLEASVDARFFASAALEESRWQAIKDMHYRRQERLKLQGHDRYSIFGNPAEAGALRSIMDWAAQQGCARHYWLDISGTPAAFALGIRTGATYLYYFIGMEERAERFSGGKLLLCYLIEKEARQGARCIDMMQGMNRNKERFSNQQNAFCQVFHENERLISAARNSWVRVAKTLTGRSEPTTSAS